VSPIFFAAISAGGLFAGMVLCFRTGWLLGRRRLAVEGDEGSVGLGAVDGAVYGLMGLMIAFTFTGAAARFDQRRGLIAQQVNAIGTAYQRLEMLEPGPRDQLRGLMRDYVDLVILLGANADDTTARNDLIARLGPAQDRLWSAAVAIVRADPAKAPPVVLLPAFNSLFDAMQLRLLASRNHPPLAIFMMLGVLVLVSALMAGFGMAKTKRQSRLHVWGFSAVVSLAIYLILDLEYPRLGLIRVDGSDQGLVEVRATMK
jgi:hypothetical protein